MKKYTLVGLGLLVFLPVFAFASFDTDVHYGSAGPAVTALQEFLIDQGVLRGQATGNFYSLTLKAVKDFQKAEGITPVSGYFGPTTRGVANKILLTQVSNSEGNATATKPSVDLSQSTKSRTASTKNDTATALQNQINALLDQIQTLSDRAKAQTVTQSVAATSASIPQPATATIPVISRVPVTSQGTPTTVSSVTTPTMVSFGQGELERQRQLENQRLAEEKVKAEEGTKVQGIISQNTVWTLENSPYLVVDNILIESGISLKIERGVIVRFTQNKFIQVMGDLQAIGTKENPVLFTANIANPNSGFWGPIKIGLAGEYERGGNITLEYCKIEYGKGINIEAQVFHESDFNNFAIKNCVFEKNSSGIYAHRPGPHSYVKNSIFTDNLVGIYIGWDIKYIKNQKNIDVVYNIFKNNNIGLQIANYGGIPPDTENHSMLQIKWNIFLQNRKYNLEMKYKSDLVVVDNWWGTTDTSIIESKINDYSDDFEKGKAVYIPFAATEFAGAGVQ